MWRVQEIFRLFRLDIATGGQYRDKFDEPFPDLSRHTAENYPDPDSIYHELENLRSIILNTNYREWPTNFCLVISTDS